MAKPDLTEFFRYSQPKRRPCPVAFAVEQLDEGERTQLTAACATDQGIITNAAIEKWLSNRGHTASVSAIVVHRKGTCSCARA